jgi:hypothetical protein
MSGTLASVLVIAASFAIGVLIGALAALLALPFRRRWDKSPTVRLALGAGIAVLAFGIAFAGLSRLFAEAVYYVIGADINAYDERVEPGSELQGLIDTWNGNRGGITGELWVRQMAPPFQAGRCYTDHDICTYLNDQVALGIQTPWGLFGVYVGVGVVAAAASVLWARRLVRLSVAGR